MPDLLLELFSEEIPARMQAQAEAGGAEIALILLTHHHGDHADGAPRFRQLTGAPVAEIA